MEVVFNRASLPHHVSANALHLIDSRCRADSNQSHVFFRVPLKGCGTKYSETDLTMSFTNILTEESVNFTSGDIVTRDSLFQAKFTCNYGRKRTVGSFSFEPSRQTLPVIQSKWNLIKVLFSLIFKMGLSSLTLLLLSLS